MRNTVIITILVVVIGGFAAWMHAQPAKAFKTVQAAMDRDDPAMLAPCLDLAALRSNLKSRQTPKLPPDFPKDGPAGLLGLFGQALVESLTGALAQAAASPEGVLAMLRGAAASMPDPAPGQPPRTPSEKLFARAKSDLQGFDRYVVTAPMNAGATLTLVFSRQEARWLLTDILVAQAPPGQSL